MFKEFINEYYFGAKPVEMIVEELGYIGDPQDLIDMAFKYYGVIRHPDSGLLCKVTMDVPEIEGDDKASCFKRAYYNYIELSVQDISEIFTIRRTLCNKYINELIRDYGVIRYDGLFYKILDDYELYDLRIRTL